MSNYWVKMLRHITVLITTSHLGFCQPPHTFKQIEEESLSICDLYVLLIIWCGFFLNLLVVVFVQETEGITHANGVAEIQALAVLSKVLCTNPHFLIFLCCS